ncbi:MAG: TolC family protein, partial [Myxococcota bacterium]
FANPLENFTASLDLVLQWNLFEGRATTARVDQARVQVRKAQAQLEALERQTLAEVEDARQRWFDQERTFGFAQEQISAAKDALRLARGLYEAGRGTSLELRTAELELTRAQIAAINARLDAETARADLAQAVGIESWAE